MKKNLFCSFFLFILMIINVQHNSIFVKASHRIINNVEVIENENTPATKPESFSTVETTLIILATVAVFAILITLYIYTNKLRKYLKRR